MPHNINEIWIAGMVHIYAKHLFQVAAYSFRVFRIAVFYF
jgi:hypothetical protein